MYRPVTLEEATALPGTVRYALSIHCAAPNDHADLAAFAEGPIAPRKHPELGNVFEGGSGGVVYFSDRRVAGTADLPATIDGYPFDWTRREGIHVNVAWAPDLTPGILLHTGVEQTIVKVELQGDARTDSLYFGTGPAPWFAWDQKPLALYSISLSHWVD